ncbi:MAG: hypothetical protein OCD76_20565 [Reichenbachiella sp.]
MLSKISKGSLLFSLFISIISFSCSQDEGVLTSDEEISNEFSQESPSSTLRVYDSSGKYFIDYQFSSSSQEVLDEELSSGYVLLLNEEIDAEIEIDFEEYQEEEQEETESDEVEITAIVNNFDESITSYSLKQVLIDNPAARWGGLCKSRTYTHKSYGSDKMYLKNNNGVDLYVDLYYLLEKPNSTTFGNLGWDDIASSNVYSASLKSNFDIKSKGSSKTLNTCVEGFSYAMAVRIKTKKCKSYSLTFYDLHCGDE